MRMPGDRRLVETELARELCDHVESTCAERCERAGGSAELSRERE